LQSISSAPQTIPGIDRACRRHQGVQVQRSGRASARAFCGSPADKGRAKWHDKAAVCFSASITRRSASRAPSAAPAFYRDLIGLSVAGGSGEHRHDAEQLDNAFGAVVRITGLRPSSDASPSLEFLQYVTPSGGRSSPNALRPNDLVLTRTVVEVDDLDALAAKCRAHGVSFISPGPVAVAGEAWSKALMVKDPMDMRCCWCSASPKSSTRRRKDAKEWRRRN
jgi:hypothetical protein